MQIKVLEKALCVETVFSYDILETEHDVLHCSSLISGGFAAAINSLSAYIIKNNINALFKSFLCEDLVNVVNKIFPANMFAFFGCFEMLG